MDIISHKIQTEHFEVDQYVRVQLSNGRSEIGVVVEVDESEGVAVVETRHGYQITVRLSSVRRAFLLVLDLNGVLVARGRGSFINRPGVDEFVKFVMNNFVVAVWTSGLERTSNPIIDSVFDGFQDRLLFKLYRDSCTVLPTPEKPYRTIKNLQRIFDDYPKSFHAVNTIIVDDSPDKCSHPDIALCPVPFSDPEKQMNDNGLALAMEVLKEILRTESSAPLIRASEERLLALAAQELERKDEEKEMLAKQGANNGKKSEGGPDRAAAVAGGLPETLLWTTRLCCDHISGGCVHDGCRFSHDADDGRRPCSRKGLCRRGHARRWTEDTRGAGTSPLHGQKKTNAEARGVADVPQIVSLFSACAKKNHHDGDARKNREWERIKQQVRQQVSQQEEMPRKLRDKQKRQQHGLQNKEWHEEESCVGKDSDSQRSKQTTSGGGRTDAAHKRWSDVDKSSLPNGHGTSSQHDGLPPRSMAMRGVSVHLSADSQDGFALLRQLRAKLSSSASGGKGGK